MIADVNEVSVLQFGHVQDGAEMAAWVVASDQVVLRRVTVTTAVTEHSGHSIEQSFILGLINRLTKASPEGVTVSMKHQSQLEQNNDYSVFLFLPNCP